jgi:D-alanine-D-alanine ligase
MHGTFAEDGTLQGMLELAMVPFVGAGMAGSLLGMDKDVAKRLVRQAGVPVVPWIDVSREQWDSGQNAVLKRAMNDLDLPFFVKPVKAGSSVGVSKVHGEDEFAPAMEKAFRFDNRVLVETGYDVDEIECSVLGNQEPKASVPGRIIPRHEFYSYESKYIDPEGADLEIPARISDEQARTVREYAVKVYRALQCAGMARVDFFLTLDSGRVFFNEINTLPGFTSISMYPKLWEASGIPYPELIDRLIELAFEKHERISRLEWEL